MGTGPALTEPELHQFLLEAQAFARSEEGQRLQAMMNSAASNTGTSPTPQTDAGGAGQKPPTNPPPAAGTPSPGDIDPDDLSAISNANDQIFLGVVEPDGSVHFYLAGGAGTGLPAGHRYLPSECRPEGSHGFSIGVKDGQVVFLQPSSALNPGHGKLPKPAIDAIAPQLPQSPNFHIQGY